MNAAWIGWGKGEEGWRGGKQRKEGEQGGDNGGFGVEVNQKMEEGVER